MIRTTAEAGRGCRHAGARAAGSWSRRLPRTRGAGRAALPLLVLGALLGIACGAEDQEAILEFCGNDRPVLELKLCEGGVVGLYSPATPASGDGMGSFDVFPDDFYTRPDAASPTGLRLHVTEKTAPWLKTLTPEFRRVVEDLAALDGWGTTAGLYLRFDGPIAAPPTGEVASVASDALILAALVDGKAQRVPYEARLIDGGQTILLDPMVPLRPATEHVLLMTNAYQDTAGGCVAPSPWLGRALLRSSDELGSCEMGLRYEKALKILDVDRTSVSAIGVFTTQSILAQSVAIAEDIAARKYTFKKQEGCGFAVATLYRTCKADAEFADYRSPRPGQEGRKEEDIWRWAPPDASLKPTGTFTHRVNVFLPTNGKKPSPLVIFGHGLGANRKQAEELAEIAAPLNLAAASIDAVRHGEHPLGGAESTMGALLDFFGISLNPIGFDFLSLRDNWRQSTWDKLQLIELIRQNPDVDGDGLVDIDVDRIGYLGVSLGGIMGPELLALTPHLKFAVLSVPGGKVTSIIQESSQFGKIITLFKPKTATDGDVARFFPLLQTLVEKGDAANWGPHVLKDRLKPGGAAAPQLLFQMAIGDDIVPNGASRVLARALGIPHVGPKLQHIGLIPEQATTPVKGNVDGGKGTAGLFQFDRVTRKKGAEVSVANHSHTPSCLEAMAQDKHFIEAWLGQGMGEVIDPYVKLGTPKLP